MVKFALPLTTLAMAASVAAAPAGVSGTTFSFEQWVEDIIANPDTALTPDEAVAAASSVAVVGSAGGLQKRAPWCDGPWQRAPGRDAAACVDYLARIGGQGFTCSIPDRDSSAWMCRIGGAEIAGSRGETSQGTVSTNCGEVARAGGRVFDSCWRSDDTITGAEFINVSPSGRIQVTIVGRG